MPSDHAAVIGEALEANSGGCANGYVMERKRLTCPCSRCAAHRALAALVSLTEERKQLEEALIRCAELAGVDGEAIEAARSGALVCPPLSDFAVEAVEQLRRDYDEGKS